MLETINYSTSAALLCRLGNELIKDRQTAFFELVKNGYDADATDVNIKFHKVLKPGGIIIIQDNGGGMDENDIKNKWARAAGENKVKEPYTPRFNRRRLGAKGIGRFSLAKLGSKIKVITKPNNFASQFVFSIDFKEFTDDKNFDDMVIDYKIGPPRKYFTNGTILEINELHDKWNKRDIEKAKSQLSHLIDPDSKDQNFHIYFESTDFPELSGPITSSLTGNESHKVTFKIDNSGNYTREIIVMGSVKKEKEKRTPLSCGPIEGIIRYYKEGVKARDRVLSDQIDESHMGMKVYRDNCRVRPYGEDNDDWLEIKSKRAKSGGKYYIHSNAIAGSVYISSKTNPALIDATNREAGIIQNAEFFDFLFFVQEHVDLLNQVLEQENRSESQKKKRQTVQKILDTVVECLNQEESNIYGEYIAKIDRSKNGNRGQTVKKKESKVRDLKPISKEEWHCKDCNENWRVTKGNIPHKCMDFAVNRDNEPRNLPGCGSSNIERSMHKNTSDTSDLTAIIAGDYALISGRQLKLRVDYDMGSNEDEFIIGEREIVINGNHVTYKVAEHLDRVSGQKYEIGDDVLVPALTVHIAKCACLSWAELHYKETKNWEEYKNRYDHLQSSIFNKVKSELGIS